MHVGVAHVELNQSEYVRAMQASKLWLSTTGPADLVGTRYFEVMATGTTLCICNRMEAGKERVYSSLGIVEGRHVVAFSSIDEFIGLVTNYTTRPEFETRRKAMVEHAQEFARRKLSWLHVAKKVELVLHRAVVNRDTARASADEVY